MDPKVRQLYSRVDSLLEEFWKGGGKKYIDEAIVLDREALGLCPPGHPGRPIPLTCLAVRLLHRFNHLGAMMDLDEAIVLGKEALELVSPWHPGRFTCMESLANHLFIRYSQLGEMNDLNHAIVLNRGALAFRPPGHPLRSFYLDNLARGLSTRHKRLRTLNDLNEAILLARAVLVLRPSGNPHRSMSLHNLARSLSIRHEQVREMEDLNEAISLTRDALTLCPPGNPERSSSLNDLGNYLYTRYEQLGEVKNLDESVILTREALALRPLGHSGRAVSLMNLAVRLFIQYKQLGVLNDLDEIIALARNSLQLFPQGHHDRSTSLNNLADYLSARYKQLGATEDLNEAIVLARDALTLCPPGHSDYSRTLTNLANYLNARYEQLGALGDLNESIILSRDALALYPPAHPNRAMPLGNLAVHLWTRHKQLGVTQDLDEAIVLSRDALALCLPGDRNRFIYMTNLAVHLAHRFKQFKTIEDINEAIALERDALALFPHGHPDRSISLNNLGTDLLVRYNELGVIKDLDDAIIVGRDALMLRPSGHPDRSMSLHNLAASLFAKYNHLGAVEDIDEAISLCRDALEYRQPGHPSRPDSLENLAQFLYTRFTRLGQPKDKDQLFSVYAELAQVSKAVTHIDLSAAGAWVRVAEEFKHPSTLLAYETSLRLLVHYLATLPPLPQHLPVLKKLTSSLAVDAFSACLRNHSPTNAVELLEQGRGAFWSLLSRLRSPLDGVIASGPAGKVLADKFTQLSASVRSSFNSSGADQHDRVYRLNIELQRLVTDIHEIPGLSRFLLPPLFSELQQAACDGPIIIVNASEYGCDALIVLHDQDPTHIPLPITREGVQELSSRLRTLTVRAQLIDMTRDLGQLLRKLWDDVVSHIVDVLLTKCFHRSRIWWCPTAEFSLLPLHAAGPYRKGQKNLAELYVSSYTPTVAALIRARRHNPSNSVGEWRRFIAIGQAQAIGENELHSVSTELENLGQCVDGLAAFTCIGGPESCIARVTEELGKSSWVHFACHGLPNRKQPFESAFALHDGHFTIERIIQCELENPEFAYLSACHTTVGDEESPDEVIHLASAMQLAGFRSVIGTMWAVDDANTNKITSMFYTHMVDKSGCLDHTRAAFALNKTMRTLTDIPFDQRILYIHLGA